MHNQNTLSDEDFNLASQIYFYLQDITLDMEYALDNIKEIINEYSKLEKEAKDKYKNQKELQVAINNNYKFRREFYLKAAKITTNYNTIILGICRASESIKSGSKILRKISKEIQEDLMSFVKKNYTPEIISYRNGYLAHPLDSERNYKTRYELLSILCKIINFEGGIHSLDENYLYEHFKTIIKHDENNICTDSSESSIPAFNLLVLNLFEKIEEITKKTPIRI